MPWGAVISAAAAYYGSRQQKKAAEKGAEAQAEGSQAAIAEQRRQFDLTRQDMAPWMQQGQWALDQRRKAIEGDWSGFMNSPDYKYALEAGQNQIDGRAASRGGLFGGGNTRDAIKFGQGMALQNYNAYDSRLAGISGTGQHTAGTLGQFGAQMANNIGNQYNNIGQARASAYGQIGQANANMGAAIGGAFNYMGQNRGWWG